MKEVLLTLEIVGTWEHEPPGYRIFINDEMICERAFYAMEYEMYNESMLLSLEPGKEYNFIFEQITSVFNRNRLSYKNLQLDGKPVRPTFTVSN